MGSDRRHSNSRMHSNTLTCSSCVCTSSRKKKMRNCSKLFGFGPLVEISCTRLFEALVKQWHRSCAFAALAHQHINRWQRQWRSRRITHLYLLHYTHQNCSMPKAIAAEAIFEYVFGLPAFLKTFLSNDSTVEHENYRRQEI